MYKPALRIYGIAKESSNFKELTRSDGPGSTWRLLSGLLQQGLLDVDSPLNEPEGNLHPSFCLFLRERGRHPG